jgi:hypothetical protein
MNHSSAPAVTENCPANGDSALSAEEELSQRWRRAILKLSDNLRAAASARSDLTPILMEALNYALRQLLEHGNDYYIAELEEWLTYEELATPVAAPYAGPERRESGPRRGSRDRRRGERRLGEDRRSEATDHRGGSPAAHHEPIQRSSQHDQSGQYDSTAPSHAGR